jgi:hypothetical protein
MREMMGQKESDFLSALLVHHHKPFCGMFNVSLIPNHELTHQHYLVMAREHKLSSKTAVWVTFDVSASRTVS